MNGALRGGHSTRPGAAPEVDIAPHIEEMLKL